MLGCLIGVFGVSLALFASWVLCSFLSFNYSAKSKRVSAAASKLPGLERKFLIGNISQIPRKQKDLIGFFQKLGRDNNGMCCVFFGPQPQVMITKGSLAGLILKSSKHSSKSFSYEMIHSWLGTGLLTSNGDKWKGRRRLLTPAFHFDILDRTLSTMIEHTRVALSLFHTHATHDSFVDIWEAMSLLALDIVSDSAMGVELGSQMRNPDSLDYVQNRSEVSEILVERFRNPILWNDFIYFHLTSKGRQYKKLVKKLHKFTTDVITCRWEEIKDHLDNMVGGGKRNSFLDLLLLAKEQHGLSFVDIREEVDTFMFEGHDTTSAAMSFVIQKLATHPNVMERLQNEVDENLEGVALEPDNVQQIKKILMDMPYLDAVLKEGLRLYPSVPAISRELSEDITLNNYHLAQGTSVMLHIYSIHRDPDVYDEPDRFNPDRWINKEVPVDENPYCYIPFSAGPRNCIGQKFAQLEEKLIIASVVRYFDLQSDTREEDMRPFGQIILRPLNKFNIKFATRSGVDFRL